MADTARATSPVVSKGLEATIVVLYIGLVAATLYGGVVPEYRAAAGEEVAERTTAAAAADIERAVPPSVARAETRVDVRLPATIAGHSYRIHADDERLVLEHPDPEIAAEVPLVLPDSVTSVSGSWESGGRATVRVAATDAGLEVSLR